MMKVMFLATEDNKMHLMHILLNANNCHEHRHEVAVVLECGSPRLLIGIADNSIRLPAFEKAMENGIIDHACRACTANFSATEAAEELGVSLRGGLAGHSDLLEFSMRGFDIVTF